MGACCSKCDKYLIKGDPIDGKVGDTPKLARVSHSASFTSTDKNNTTDTPNKKNGENGIGGTKDGGGKGEEGGGGKKEAVKLNGTKASESSDDQKSAEPKIVEKTDNGVSVTQTSSSHVKEQSEKSVTSTEVKFDVPPPADFGGVQEKTIESAGSSQTKSSVVSSSVTTSSKVVSNSTTDS